MQRGYYGIGIFHGKNSENLGTLWRTASNLGADFIFTIGKRYQKQGSDTTKAYKHIPLYHYADFADFIEHMPYDCPLVGIELDDRACDLQTYIHPKRCIYLLGAEDHGISCEVLQKCKDIIMVNSNQCMNVAVTGGIVMYDRMTKAGVRHGLV